MKVFVKCQRSGSDWYVAYEGQSEATVAALLADLGVSGVQFIDEATYIAATPPK